MESVIKWKTGEPKEYCECIVTLETGEVVMDTYRDFYVGIWGCGYSNVVAWCKLSDIKPYDYMNSE